MMTVYVVAVTRSDGTLKTFVFKNEDEAWAKVSELVTVFDSVYIDVAKLRLKG